MVAEMSVEVDAIDDQPTTKARRPFRGLATDAATRPGR
jgi:hypothetical protein